MKEFKGEKLYVALGASKVRRRLKGYGFGVQLGLHAKNVEGERLMHETGNLLDGIPTDVAEEMFTMIRQTHDIRIERIVSQGQASPPGVWYDQDENEWVIVIEGSAAVQFAGDSEPVVLQRGSYLNIPAHKRHRVAWTDPNQKTVWLAIHYKV
jgi:cupin 2 domain-containing protein